MPDVIFKEGKLDSIKLSELYQKYAPLVHARAKRILREEADDVVQEVFIRLMRNPPEEGRMTAWMYKTSTNLCLDRLRYLRRRHAQWQGELRNYLENKPSSIEQILNNKELCVNLLALQDRKTQQIVMLIYFDEMNQEETATLLGLSRKTVGERLRRFEKQGRRLIEKWKIEAI